jgi:hypothetical protein
MWPSGLFRGNPAEVQAARPVSYSAQEAPYLLTQVCIMVEVFRTNVKGRRHARRLLAQIHAHFEGYRANFDLEDCDQILRVESQGECIQPGGLIRLLREAGFQAEVLPD